MMIYDMSFLIKCFFFPQSLGKKAEYFAYESVHIICDDVNESHEGWALGTPNMKINVGQSIWHSIPFSLLECYSTEHFSER